MMCTNKASGSSEAGALSDLQDSGKTPSSRWVLGKIRAIDAREIRERCDHAIKREALDMKKAGMFRNPVVVAIDEHLVGLVRQGFGLAIHNPLQVEKRDEQVLQLGHGALRGRRIQGPRLGPGSSRKRIMTADVVSKLLEKCSELRIRSSRVLLDRGFFSVDVIQTLNLHGKAFIMPRHQGTGNQEGHNGACERETPGRFKVHHDIKGRIYRDIHAGNTGKDARSPTKSRRRRTGTLYLQPMRRARSKQDLISKIPDEYKKRWGIEDRICLHGKDKAANLQQERLDQDAPDVPSAGDLQRMDHGKLRGWRVRRWGQARHHTQAPHVSLYPDS